MDICHIYELRGTDDVQGQTFIHIFLCKIEAIVFVILNILIWGVQTGLCSCAFQSYFILVSRFNMLFTIKQQIYIKLYCLILLYLEP